MEGKKIQINIYPMTGRQGLFSIPKNWCQECDLAIAFVEDAIKDLGIENDAILKIRPWFLWAWLPFLRYLAWHPPILVINGKLISQGTVPEREKIVEAFKNIVD